MVRTAPSRNSQQPLQICILRSSASSSAERLIGLPRSSVGMSTAAGRRGEDAPTEPAEPLVEDRTESAPDCPLGGPVTALLVCGTPGLPIVELLPTPGSVRPVALPALGLTVPLVLPPGTPAGGTAFGWVKVPLDVDPGDAAPVVP